MWTSEDGSVEQACGWSDSWCEAASEKRARSRAALRRQGFSCPKTTAPLLLDAWWPGAVDLQARGRCLMAAGSMRRLGGVCGDVARAGGTCEPTSKPCFLA